MNNDYKGYVQKYEYCLPSYPQREYEHILEFYL